MGHNMISPRLFGGVRIVNRPDLENVARLDRLPMPMVAAMMRNGMRVDVDYLKSLSTRLQSEMDHIAEQIYRIAGRKFLLSSGDQMAEVLFNELGIKQAGKVKMTKSGDRESTDADVLESLRFKHPIIPPILDWRERAKLKTTYADNLPRMLDSNHRLHTEILTTRTDTGRMACVAWWTMIKTHRGSIPICDVKIGDLVWTHRQRWRKVTGTWIKGVSKMFNVLFSNGNVLTCTGDHRLLVSGYEHIQVLDPSTVERADGSQDVSVGGVPNPIRDSETIGHYISQRPLGGNPPYTQSRVSGVGSNKVLTLQAREEEPHVWKDGGPASQLEGSSRGWVRVSDLFEWRKKAVCTQVGDGEGFRTEGTTGEPGCTPHRREPEEQSFRQSGSGDEARTPQITLPCAEGPNLISIKEIYPAGCFDVFDISVDEDESYESCGVFSHNSKNPNLQNIPARTKLGKEIRNAFIPSRRGDYIGDHRVTEDYVIGTIDLSQIEMRTQAEDSKCWPMIELYQRGEDLYWGTAEKMFKRTFTPEERKEGRTPEGLSYKEVFRFAAKETTLMVSYDVTAAGLQTHMHVFIAGAYWDRPELAQRLMADWTEDKCQEMIDLFYSIYPEIPERRAVHHRRARRYGFNWDMWGRIRHIPQVRSALPWVVREGLRGAGNLGGQGGAAGVLKLGMGVAWHILLTKFKRAGIFPLMTIHDEMLFEGPKNAVEDYLGSLKTMFENLVPWDCPISSGTAVSEKSWGDLDK